MRSDTREERAQSGFNVAETQIIVIKVTNEPSRCLEISYKGVLVDSEINM
jgi:hypothetical protein